MTVNRLGICNHSGTWVQGTNRLWTCTDCQLKMTGGEYAIYCELKKLKKLVEDRNEYTSKNHT